MTERKPPVITEKTQIGPDVDLDHEDVRLPGGIRLTRTRAAAIVDEIHQTIGKPGESKPELAPVRGVLAELARDLWRDLRQLRLSERVVLALRRALERIESHSKVH
jgi:hypothetical protein